MKIAELKALKDKILKKVLDIEKNAEWSNNTTKKILHGTVTYDDLYDCAEGISNAFVQAFDECLTDDVLLGLTSDDVFPKDVADKVISPLLKKQQKMIDEYAEYVQRSLNKRAFIDFQAKMASGSLDRIEGLTTKLKRETVEQSKDTLKEPVKTLSRSAVDRTIQANAKAHYNVGLSPKIIRIAEPNCCDWCTSLAGVYYYPNVPKDVFRRHERCRCRIEYDPDNGAKNYQNVHTKRWTSDAKSDKIETTKVIGLKINDVAITELSAHVYERMEARNITIDEIADAVMHPLKVNAIKFDEMERPSFAVIGMKATVSINPENGIMVTVYPTHTKTAKKLLKK